MSHPESFERIYEVSGVPITLFEIEEWWENAAIEIKKFFPTPDSGEKARYTIASQIVKEMYEKNEREKADILKTFRKEHQRQKDELGTFLNKRKYSRRNDFDELSRIRNNDIYEMTGEVPRLPRRRDFGISTPKPPDLPPIPSFDPTGHGMGSIFHQAMYMAQEKLRKEQEQAQQREYVQYHQRYNYYKNAQPHVEKVEDKKGWKTVFGFEETQSVTKQDMVKAFRKLALVAHPDTGGSEKEMQDLIDARDQALKELQ